MNQLHNNRMAMPLGNPYQMGQRAGGINRGMTNWTNEHIRGQLDGGGAYGGGGFGMGGIDPDSMNAYQNALNMLGNISGPRGGFRWSGGGRGGGGGGDKGSRAVPDSGPSGSMFSTNQKPTGIDRSNYVGGFQGVAGMQKNPYKGGGGTNSKPIIPGLVK